MPVFALSKAVYDKLGDEVTNELVEWLNAIDRRLREDYLDRLRLYNGWTHLHAGRREPFTLARDSAPQSNDPVTGELPHGAMMVRERLPFPRHAEQTMGMVSHTERWTAEQVRNLPDDGNRYEVVDGELLVTPSPRRVHQTAVGQLFVLLDTHARVHGIGLALVSPADIELDPHGMVQPDVFVEGLVDGAPSRDWNSGAPLLLAVEVLSPSTARADRVTKRLRYQRHGVPEYWIVDLDARTIERWRPDDQRPEILGDTITWQPLDAPPLQVDLAALFARIHGEAL